MTTRPAADGQQRLQKRRKFRGAGAFLLATALLMDLSIERIDKRVNASCDRDKKAFMSHVTLKTSPAL